MSEQDSSAGLRNDAVLFEFNPRSVLEDRRLVELYATSGVALWAQEREERYLELVEPRLMYVDPNDMHRVAWVKHVGVSETEDGPPRPYSVHHVVCDCAAEADAGTEAHPASAISSCEYVEAVLGQRAQELGRQHGNADILNSLLVFDEEAWDFRLSSLGQEMVIRAIAYVLATDKRHPESWMANRISGLHDIATLAAIMLQGTQEVMPLLELMETSGTVEIRNGIVRIPPGFH